MTEKKRVKSNKSNAGSGGIELSFVKSAQNIQGWPKDKRLEVAIVGRSNAGKSSFINGLSGRKLAKVSSSPGKTRLLNFFNVGGYWRLVDMPGYGFASRSGSEMTDWRKMIEEYLTKREQLAGLLIVMDCRRSWDKDEQLLVDWMQPRGLPMAIVLTKADKVSEAEIKKTVSKMKKDSGLSDVFVTSTLKKMGQDLVEKHIFDKWIKVKLKGVQ